VCNCASIHYLCEHVHTCVRVMFLLGVYVHICIYLCPYMPMYVHVFMFADNEATKAIWANKNVFKEL